MTQLSIVGSRRTIQRVTGSVYNRLEATAFDNWALPHASLIRHATDVTRESMAYRTGMVSREQVEQWRLYPNTRYAWRTVDETVDVGVYAGGKALLADLSIGIALDVSFQVLGDWNDPYLSQLQRQGRVLVAGTGAFISTVSGVALKGVLVAAGIGSGPAGWIGLGGGLLVDAIWNFVAAPWIYEHTNLNPERYLQPLE